MNASDKWGVIGFCRGALTSPVRFLCGSRFCCSLEIIRRVELAASAGRMPGLASDRFTFGRIERFAQERHDETEVRDRHIRIVAAVWPQQPVRSVQRCSVPVRGDHVFSLEAKPTIRPVLRLTTTVSVCPDAARYEMAYTSSAMLRAA